MLRKILVFPILVYQKGISRFLKPRCRFYPSCSEYTRQAIMKYGIKGIWLGMKRIVKCHPFHKGGVDLLK